MKLNTVLTSLCLTVSTLLFFACQREVSSTDTVVPADKARMQVYLVDTPGNYQEVVIDVRDIRINYSTDSAEGWQGLANINAGLYDVLKFTNGNDTLLSSADITPGKVNQIRLILGSNNYVKVGGQTYPLETPSAQQSGLKINLKQDVAGGQAYKLVLDFDATRSIVKTGNGKYILKPVIRASFQPVSGSVNGGGSIKGFVSPTTFTTAVYAINGTDTIGTATSNGGYVLQGLNAGTYTLNFIPSDTSYKAQTKTGITVTANTATTVDSVFLVK